MKKSRFIQKAIGLTLVIGGFIMSMLHFLVDWEMLSIPFPKVFTNFFLTPMWIGILIYHYRPGLNLTSKRLSWAAIVLFSISLVTMILSRGTWIHQASEIAITLSGFLAIIAWIKITVEKEYLKDDERMKAMTKTDHERLTL